MTDKLSRNKTPFYTMKNSKLNNSTEGLKLKETSNQLSKLGNPVKTKPIMRNEMQQSPNYVKLTHMKSSKIRQEIVRYLKGKGIRLQA